MFKHVSDVSASSFIFYIQIATPDFLKVPLQENLSDDLHSFDIDWRSSSGRLDRTAIDFSNLFNRPVGGVE